MNARTSIISTIIVPHSLTHGEKMPYDLKFSVQILSVLRHLTLKLSWKQPSIYNNLRTTCKAVTI
jgi:hypothetical protein